MVDANPNPPQMPTLANADIPPRYRRYLLADFPPSVVREVEQWLADDDSWSLYLWGDTDARKSSLAGAILMEMRRRWLSRWWESLGYGYQRYYADHPDRVRPPGLLLPMEDAVPLMRRPGTEEYAKAMAVWRAAPWLVLDDVGTHRDTDHVVETLQQLMHHRYIWHEPQQGTRLIVTANMTLNELARRINAATARRLEEGAVWEMSPPKKESPNE